MTNDDDPMRNTTDEQRAAHEAAMGYPGRQAPRCAFCREFGYHDCPGGVLTRKNTRPGMGQGIGVGRAMRNAADYSTDGWY